jgi:hypothetical protein
MGRLVGELRLVGLYSSVLFTYLILKYWNARTPEGIRGREIRFWVPKKQSTTSEATFCPCHMAGGLPAAGCMKSTGVASRHSPLCSQSTIPPVVPDAGPVNSCAFKLLKPLSSSRPNEIAGPVCTPRAHVQARTIYVLDSPGCSLSRIIPHFVTLLPRICDCDV